MALPPEVQVIDLHLNAAQEGCNQAANLVARNKGQLDNSTAPLVTAISALATAHATTASAMMQALAMKP